jgi:hypothetical protein
MSQLLKFGLLAGGTTLGMLFLAWNFARSLAPPTISSPTDQATPSAALNPQTEWANFYDLVFTGTNILPTSLAFDQTSQTVAFLDVQQQIIIQLAQKQKRFQTLPAPSAAPTTALTYHEGQLYVWANALYAWQTDSSSWLALTDSFTLSAPVTALASFGQNFYLFGSGLIERLNFSPDFKFIDHAAWLTQPSWLVPAPQSVLVDGYIFAAEPSGQILKLMRGQNQPQTLKPSPAGQVCLTNSDEFLSAFGVTQNTLYQYDFEGKLQHQLPVPALAPVTACYFDSISSTLFALSETKVYSLSINE